MDQYYTKINIANECYNHLKGVLEAQLNINVDNYRFIEPSAGTGSFYDLIETTNKLGFDINPKHPAVSKRNFFSYLDFFVMPPPPTIVIGNPPFGYQNQLTIAFINHSALFSDFVGFIVPLSMRTWTHQRQVDFQLKLISQLELPMDSFYYIDKENKVKDYDKIGVEFQLWARKETGLKDLRLQKEPLTKHSDYTTRQYNPSIMNDHFFDLPFLFAIPNHGFNDYKRKETDPKKCNRNVHWLLFFADDPKVKERLVQIDYEALAQKNRAIFPGVTAASIVEEYTRLYGE